MYQQSGVNYTIVHSLDGYDEVSLTSPFKALNNRGEGIYLPEEIGFGRVAEEELWGGNTVTEAAAIFDRVLANEATRGQEDCVIANAAFAIRTLRPGIALPDAIAEAREALESGRALRAFRKFVELNEK